MYKKTGILCILAGAALIFSALFLYTKNQKEDKEAGNEAVKILEQWKEQELTENREPEKTEERSKEEKAEGKKTEERRMEKESEKTVVIDGNAYIGRLQIPALNLELPVMAQWSYENLRVAPCRQFGSAEEGNLVIAAHNYASHFGRLNELSLGDQVLFTDAKEVVWSYEVEKTETPSPDQAEEVADSGYGLVLYSCNYSGQSRVAVFCRKL